MAISKAELVQRAGMARPARQESLWRQPATFRVGSLIVVLVRWEIAGPYVNPIFFHTPRRSRTHSTSSG